MQEEVENRTVNLAISTTKLTFRTIVNGYNAWKRHHQARGAGAHDAHGRPDEQRAVSGYAGAAGAVACR